MFERIKEIGATLFGWIVPALIAIGVAVAMNKANNKRAKEKRLEGEVRRSTQDYIDDRGGDVVAANSRLQAATKKRKQADAKAKAKLEALANTSEPMADSLDRYRRERGL